MTTVEPVRFAIVGLGYGSTRCQLLRETPGVELVAVADSTEERARTWGEKCEVFWTTDHTEVLSRPDVDVVAVYTPSGLHLDVALDAAAAGKHILMTKPIEITLERIDRMIEGCAGAGVELFCEYYSRYYPDVYRARKAIAEGVLGRLVLGEFSWKGFRPDSYYTADGAWRRTKELQGGGVIMNQAMHSIDELQWCMGEVESVRALTGTFTHDIEVEDTAAALLQMRSGAIAQLTGTSTFRTTRGLDTYYDYGGGSTTRLEVHGDRGSVTVVDEVLENHLLDTGDPVPAAEGMPPNVFADVAAALRDPGYRSLTLARGPEARVSVEIAMAIYESARTGEEVRIPHTGIS